MTTSELRRDDVRRLVDVVQDSYADDPGEAMPWALLEGLERLVSCDFEVNYQHHAYDRYTTELIEGVAPGGRRLGYDRPGYEGPEEPFWAAWWASACSWPQRTGDLRSVVHTGDFFPTERARRADPMRPVLPELGCCMIVSLPAAPGEARRVLFMRRPGRAFSERDRQIAMLVRPHLQEIWLDAERRRAHVPVLTPREWEVLALTAAGRSHAEIAAQLVISIGTVRKHMEHVRERLGVHSAAAAAAIAMPHAPAHLRVRSTAAARRPSSPDDDR